MTGSTAPSPAEAAPRSRPPLLRVLIAVVPAVAFLGLLWVGLAKTGAERESGGAAPAFDLPLVDGSGNMTDDDLRGKVVVINFWASWCVPCREEAPLLEKAWRAYRDEGVVVLGVNVKDAESDARRFVEEFDLTYPSVRDTEQTLLRDFGVAGLPETFFVDDRWTFVGTISGSRTGDEQGTVILGAIGEEELYSNIELLLRRAGE